MKFQTLIAVIIYIFVSALPVCLAEEWAIIGARSLGMGGTGVAAARGPEAYYWNPALYAVKSHYSLAMPMGTGIAIEGDMLEKADYLADRIETIDFDALQDKFNNDPASINDDDFRNAFEILLVDIPPLAESGTGITAHGSVGAVSRLGNYGGSLLGIAYGGAHPFINLSVDGGVALSDDDIQTALEFSGVSYADHYGELSSQGQTICTQLMSDYTLDVQTASTYVWLAETTENTQGDGVDFSDPTTANIFDSITEATFGNQSASGTYEVMIDNLSGVDLGLIATREVAFTASKNFMDKRLALGINLKGIIADTYTTSIIVSTMEEGEDISEQTSDFYFDDVTSKRFGIDTGAVYSLTETVDLGLTVRNINQPTFSFEGDNDGFTLYSQTRAGILWEPTDKLSIGADLDLFPNLSEVLKDLKVQFLSTGMEWRPAEWFAFRTGIYKNIAIGESPVYTMGIGLRVWRCYLDLAGSLGFSRIKIETDEVGSDVYMPERTNFMLTMGLSLDF